MRSWKHNSLEDINGRHKQNKNNVIKRIKLEKQMNNNSNEDGGDNSDKVNGSPKTNQSTGKTFTTEKFLVRRTRWVCESSVLIV